MIIFILHLFPFYITFRLLEVYQNYQKFGVGGICLMKPSYAQQGWIYLNKITVNSHF